ncbi:RluA family pseudouridine synthase [Gramella sp. KN1008]|uniref:RluA family pseudouridine synthase n=1 Tax=Gramella sp. KN1008 TaxID=2529298 RepID=UPI001040C22E|nr:RluA family pseudouridine synthase [Gramella sp. KN1008]TBW30069.1 RluA family pseudouridine synthase [Gramella sp. KN1008]
MKIKETHIVPAVTKKVRLQEYAVSIFSSIRTRSGIKKAIKKGLLLIDGKKAHTSHWIAEGQKIELLQQEIPQKKIFRLKLNILFEDEHLAVVHKPSGYPTSGNYFKTIENALAFNLKPSHMVDALMYPLPVHRLDNPTSGILLCAKTRTALTGLQDAFRLKAVKKTYNALVKGEIPKPKVISSDIDGKNASTKISPQEILKIKHRKYTLAEVIPLTGRTHQIRIHLARNKTPIIGDKLYGKEETEDFFSSKNLYLFAVKISFAHPVNEEQMNFAIRLPKKVRNLLSNRVD